MPELPEVETVKNSLLPILVSNSIHSVQVLNPNLRWPVETEKLDFFTKNQTIVDLSRRSKYLLIHLANKATIVIHLGMSGRLGVFDKSIEPEKHTHVIFELDENKELRFRDVRRFGCVEIVEPDELQNYPRFAHLGVEPLSDDFTPDYLYQKISHLKMPIKNALMDASLVVGVGNIYANESLFLSKILPNRSCYSLSAIEISVLVQTVKDVLSKAIAKGGTTLQDHRNGNNEPGFFQLELNVYNRTGEPCLSCGNEIQKLTQAGRSSFYCGECQK